MVEKMMVLFQDHLKAIHDLEFYDYQLIIVRRIFEALIQNLRLTASATEEDIKKLKLVEQPVEISRQAGKTTAIVHAIEFIMIFFPRAFDRGVEIDLFAPQKEQAKTDFDRLKNALRKTSEFQIIFDRPEQEQAKEESNARTIVLPNGASCYIYPVTSTSKPESKSPDLIIFEESQDLDDLIVREQIWPMGAAKNAPRFYIGTAGTRLCHFRTIGQQANALKLYFEEIATQRRKMYEKTADARHLIYEQTVRQDITSRGLEADEIQRPYFGKWLIGTGQFTTQEEIEKIEAERKETYHDKEHECFAGIDSAKHPDSTVVTIIRAGKPKSILSWLELRGDNYKDQFDIILDFLNNYKVMALAIDATGQGDFLPDMFERETNWQDEHTGLYRVKFSAVSKDIIYKNLKVSIKELLTDLPKLDTRRGVRFKQQMLDLEQEWKGQLLSVHHPNDPNAHDDYPDSWALAEYAFAKWEENRVSADVVTVGHEKERKVVKREGRTVDYWPGVDL